MHQDVVLHQKNMTSFRRLQCIYLQVSKVEPEAQDRRRRTSIFYENSIKLVRIRTSCANVLPELLQLLPLVNFSLTYLIYSFRTFVIKPLIMAVNTVHCYLIWIQIRTGTVYIFLVAQYYTDHRSEFALDYHHLWHTLKSQLALGSEQCLLKINAAMYQYSLYVPEY